MSNKSRWVWVAMLLAFLLGTGEAVAAHRRQSRLGSPFGRALTVQPQGQVRGVALILDERVAQDRPSHRLASELANHGVLVAIVPAQNYLSHLHDGQCSRSADDAERVARRLMRKDGVQRYFEPVLVGMGPAGTALAASAVSHASPQTVAGAVLVGADDTQVASACPAGTLTQTQGFTLHIGDAPEDQAAVDAVLVHLPEPRVSFRDLPLVELPAAGSRRLVIFMSGDGGWRSLDKGVSAVLRDKGVSVVGWDSLRYFWTQRTPEQTAADLDAVINEYSRRWHADQVELVGYSFGADAMPFLYNRLPPTTRAKVRSLSLLGLGHGAAFKVSVGSWLGDSSHDVPIAPELAQVSAAKVLCVYGAKEKDTLCPELADTAIAVDRVDGGHHFDGDMPAMAARLIANFARNAPADDSAAGVGAR